jgi:hypothetical protein
MDIFKIQGKDLNFKWRFRPKDLNSIYLIKFNGRFQMEIESNSGWIWVNWIVEYFLNNFGFPLRFWNQGKDGEEMDEEVSDGTTRLNPRGNE